MTESSLKYSAVTLPINREKRTADLTVQAPTGPQPATPEEICKAGDQFWPLRAFRELDDALLRLRFNEPEIGTVVVRTEGDREAVLAIDASCSRIRSHWLVREIILFMKRTLKRIDLTSRSFFAFIEPGSAFAGTLFELALAADRTYMLDDDDEENIIALSPMNGGRCRWATASRVCRRGSSASRKNRRAAGARPGRSTPAMPRSRPGHVRARRHRLGRRGPPRDRGARGALARRDDRHGSQPALRRPGDDGDEDLRAAHGVAELDLPAAERRRRERRAEGLRRAGQAGVRLEADLEVTISNSELQDRTTDFPVLLDL